MLMSDLVTVKASSRCIMNYIAELDISVLMILSNRNLILYDAFSSSCTAFLTAQN